MEVARGIVPIRMIAMTVNGLAIRGMEIRDRTITVVTTRAIGEDQPHGMILSSESVRKTEHLQPGNAIVMAVNDKIRKEDRLLTTPIPVSEVRAIVADLIPEDNGMQTAVFLAKRDSRIMKAVVLNTVKPDNLLMITVVRNNGPLRCNHNGENHQEVRVVVTREGINEEEINPIPDGQSLQV